jgi:hypothetical protein
MGYMRKGLFLGTGGMSGLLVNANSKKERIAKALEKQNRQGAMAHAFDKEAGRQQRQALKRSKAAQAENPAEFDRQLLRDADLGWQSDRVLTDKEKLRVLELRQAQVEA